MVENWLAEMQIAAELLQNITQHERDKIEKLMMQSQASELLNQLRLVVLEY
jgi:hypothetical protein